MGSNGGLIVAGIIIAVIGALAMSELVDLLGKVIIMAGAILGVVGLVKVFSGDSQAE